MKDITIILLFESDSKIIEVNCNSLQLAIRLCDLHLIKGFLIKEKKGSTMVFESFKDGYCHVSLKEIFFN